MRLVPRVVALSFGCGSCGGEVVKGLGPKGLGLIYFWMWVFGPFYTILRLEKSKDRQKKGFLGPKRGVLKDLSEIFYQNSVRG